MESAGDEYGVVLERRNVGRTVKYILDAQDKSCIALERISVAAARRGDPHDVPSPYWNFVTRKADFNFSGRTWVDRCPPVCPLAHRSRPSIRMQCGRSISE
jgi:hypothetical protein